MKHFILASLAIAGTVTVAAAQTRARSPAATIQMRQANYKQMAGAVKGLNDQLQRRLAVASRHPPAFGACSTATRLQVLNWFPRGTGPEAGVRTRAKPEIWSDPRGFRAAGARLLVAARALDAAARRGDVAGDPHRLSRRRNRACGGCHDGYRGPAQ